MYFEVDRKMSWCSGSFLNVRSVGAKWEVFFIIICAARRQPGSIIAASALVLAALCRGCKLPKCNHFLISDVLCLGRRFSKMLRKYWSQR